MSAGITPKEALAVLAAAFRVETLSDATVQTYVAKLANIPPSLLEASVHRVVERSRFFPSIAELRHTAAGLAGVLPPTADEALAIVRRADVSELVRRRDGSYAYTERFWRWPEGLAPAMILAFQCALEHAGEPRDDDGKARFGWEQGFKACYERVVVEVVDKALAALGPASGSRLVPMLGPHKA